MSIHNLIKETINNFLNESINKKMILYHGTRKDFDKFNLSQFNSGSGDGGWLGYGIYLTNDYEYAESYGDVLECEVYMYNPFIVDDYKYSTSPNKLMNELGVVNSKGITNKLMNSGHDSVMLKYPDDRSWMDEFIEVCVFNPSNIKIINKYPHLDDSEETNKKRGYE